MSLTLTIDGVDHTTDWYLPGLDEPGKMTFSRQGGGVGPCAVTVFSMPGTTFFRPAIDKSLKISSGATDLWVGAITDVSESGLTDGRTDKGCTTTITAQDHARLFTQITYTKTYANGTTLKAILQDLVAVPFAAFGVTLDASQSTGPTLNSVAFDDASGTDILNMLQSISGYPWRLSTAKVLRMVQPGSEASGITLSDSVGTVVAGVTWQQSRSQDYVNDVLLLAGGTTRADKSYTFPAVIGTQANFVFPYPVAQQYGYIDVNGTHTPIGLTGIDAMPWTWDDANNRIVASPAAVAGTVVIMNASVQFPFTSEAQDAGEIAAHGLYRRRFDAPTVFDIAEAAQLAASFLRRGIATPRIVTVVHRSGGALIGQSVDLSFTERNISGTWIIVEVQAVDDVDGDIVYTFVCLEGSAEPLPTWLDYFRGGSAGSAGASGGGIVTGAVVPEPSGVFTQPVVAESEGVRVKIGRVGGPGTDTVPGAGIEAFYGVPGWSLVSYTGTFKEWRFQIDATYTPFKVRDDTVLGGYAIMPGQVTNALKPCYLGSTTDSFGYGRWTNVFALDLDTTNGLTEHGRTHRSGEWQDIAFAAGNFSADTGANWTLTSGDQTTLAMSLQGLTLELDFELFTTTVGGTPLYLKIALPGGRVVRHTKSGTIRRAFDNGTSITSKAMVVAIAGDAFIRIYKDDTGTANWTASTNLTDVSGTIRVPVDF